jgi:hypothetical protein
MPKNSAIKPNSLIGGDISNMNKASDMARIRIMPRAKRAGIGVWESVDFIICYVIASEPLFGERSNLQLG